MPNLSFVNTESDYGEERRQHAREEALFMYSNGLFRSDYDSVTTVLRYAETDPVLESMIIGLSPYLETACLPGADILPEQSPSVHSSSGVSFDGPAEMTSTVSWIHDQHQPEPIADEECLVADEPPPLELEWRDFVGAATTATTRLYALYLTAMDHLDQSEYELAERCADDAVQMALEVDDPEAIAECLCLYGLIESAQAMYGKARSLFTFGLMILNKAESGGAQFSDDLRVELYTLLSRLDDRLPNDTL